jgi:hypothetical protein
VSVNKWAAMVVTVVVFSTASLLGGCTGVQKRIPAGGANLGNIGENMNRSDYEVMGRVEAKASKVSYLLGLVRIYDGKNVEILGIPFFTRRYAYYYEPDWFFLLPDTLDYANYKVHAEQPEADFILQRSVDRQQRGIPLLFWGEKVTVSGKAVRLKSDVDLRGGVPR